MSEVELRSYKYERHGRSCSADFFPFVDSEPRHDINSCDFCIHYNETPTCEKAKEIGEKADDKLYLFCGAICGYFEWRRG